jgi:hypothetical protein
MWRYGAKAAERGVSVRTVKRWVAAAREEREAVLDVFTMKMYVPALGDYEMNNHVVEYELDRRIGWEPEAGRGHADAAAGQDGSRWGHRWPYELVPTGPMRRS